MSIIHEALKKAEREREPPPMGLSLYRGVRTARRRWRGGIISSMLIGVTTVGAVSAWLWVQPLREVPPLGTMMPMPQSPSAKTLEADEEGDRLPVLTASMVGVQPLEAAPRSVSDGVPSSPAPVSLALEAQATAEAAFDRAMAAESKGQWEQAKQYYRQALALNSTLVEARNNLGNLYIKQQQMTAAIGEFRAALALDPNYAVARNNLGIAYFLIGEEALALQEFLAAIRLDSVYVSPYYNLASLYARRGDAGQAVAFLTKALAIDPAVLSWLQQDPDFDAIKGSPEFQRLRGLSQARR
jgi:tetratricopeptide (TPR) repeat protein